MTDQGITMNRYAISGILRDAEQGKSVAVFAHSRVSLREAFGVMAQHCDAARIVRSNGHERIDLPNGGRITFHCAAAGGGRGLSVDVAYVDEWNAMSEKARADVAVSACRGELIRA